MEYVHAAMILHNAKKPITEEAITKILQAAGIQVDEARVKALVAALSNVNIDEVLKSVSAVSLTAPSPAAEEAKEEAAEEEAKEEREEEAVEGLSALFG